MKKAVIAGIMMLMVAAGSYAGVGINWMDDYRVFASTESDLISGSVGILDVNSAIWQLIYAGADGLANDPSIVSGGANGDYVTGDDEVWAQRTLPLGGGDSAEAEDDTNWTSFLDLNGGNTLYVDYTWAAAGFVYQRIFEGLPSNGSLYYESELLALNLGYTSDPVTSTPAQDFGVGDPVDGGVHADQVVTAVPEPATMGLLGLGALVMAIRRRRA